MRTLGQKMGGAVKTVGSKFLQFGANYLGSKGDIKTALAKTVGQTIMANIPSNNNSQRMITGLKNQNV